MKFAPALIATVAAVSQGATGAPLADSNSTKLTSCQITEYVLALQDDCGFESIHGKSMNYMSIYLCLYLTWRPFLLYRALARPGGVLHGLHLRSFRRVETVFSDSERHGILYTQSLPYYYAMY